ncbi:Respiratory burst oxidase homolog protein A [Linum perenne]
MGDQDVFERDFFQLKPYYTDAGCDRDMDGRINQVVIKQAILLSASTNRLTVTHEEAQEHAASIMEVLDSRRCGYIGPNELAALLRATLPGSSSSSSARLAANASDATPFQGACLPEGFKCKSAPNLSPSS